MVQGAVLHSIVRCAFNGTVCFQWYDVHSIVRKAFNCTIWLGTWCNAFDAFNIEMPVQSYDVNAIVWCAFICAFNTMYNVHLNVRCAIVHSIVRCAFNCYNVHSIVRCAFNCMLCIQLYDVHSIVQCAFNCTMCIQLYDVHFITCMWCSSCVCVCLFVVFHECGLNLECIPDIKYCLPSILCDTMTVSTLGPFCIVQSLWGLPANRDFSLSMVYSTDIFWSLHYWNSYLCSQSQVSRFSWNPGSVDEIQDQLMKSRINWRNPGSVDEIQDQLMKSICLHQTHLSTRSHPVWNIVLSLLWPLPLFNLFFTFLLSSFLSFILNIAGGWDFISNRIRLKFHRNIQKIKHLFSSAEYVVTHTFEWLYFTVPLPYDNIIMGPYFVHSLLVSLLHRYGLHFLFAHQFCIPIIPSPTNYGLEFDLEHSSDQWKLIEFPSKFHA